MKTRTAVYFLDTSGSPYGIAQISNKPRFSSTPYLYDIVEGSITNHSGLRKTGYNADVDNASETLWPVGGEYTFPSTSMRMEVISTSASDAATGAGARTVEIHYLDNNYAEQSETVTMNGTTAVATSASNILRVQNFHTVTAGSIGTAASDIDLRHVDNTPVYARIIAGYNSSQQAVWTVPAAKTLYIVGWQAGVGNSTGNRMAEFRLRATANETAYNAGIFHVKDIVITQDNCVFIPCPIPIKCPAYTDVKISVISDSGTANAICAGHFEGWYES